MVLDNFECKSKDNQIDEHKAYKLSKGIIKCSRLQSLPKKL